jgi:hypothetical protein
VRLWERRGDIEAKRYVWRVHLKTIVSGKQRVVTSGYKKKLSPGRVSFRSALVTVFWNNIRFYKETEWRVTCS